MWNQFYITDYHNNVSRVHDVIMGREIKGLEQVDSDGIQSLINEVLSHPDNRNHGIIAEAPGKIEIQIPEGKYDPQEYSALVQFKNSLWSINAAGGREGSHPGRVEVPMEKIKQLKEELVKMGMPDPVVHRLDSRMQNWVDRAVNHGIEEATRGLDLDPTKALVVKRLLLNGFVTLSTDANNRGVALQAPLEITREQILKIKPNATIAEVQSYIEAYGRIKANTKGVLTLREDYGLTGLTENQLGSLITADHIFNIDKLADGIKDFSSEIDQRIYGVDNGIKVLQHSMADAATPTAANEIRAIMEYQAEIRNEMNRFQISFAKTLGGGVEISRASAHLLEVQTHRDSNGKTLMQHFDELGRAPESEFTTRVEQIRDLQIAIANKVSERPDVKTQFNEMRQEEILKLKHEEIEGHMPSDNTRITPDLFLEKNNRSIDDVFMPGETGHNKTYDSAAEALYALYRQDHGNIEPFADRMFKLAGQDKVTASAELRNDIVHIAGLFERRFNVKRLTVNTTSGKGEFENTEISKGFLTDLYSEVFGLEQSTDMILLSSDYRENVGGSKRVKSFATNSEGLTSVAKVLAGDFAASLSEGSIVNQKHFKPGRGYKIEEGQDLYENIDLNKQVVSGRHYIIGIDENINLIVPEAGFNSMANAYVRWYESIIKTDYVKKARKLKAADDLFKNSLEPYYKRLIEIKGKDGRYEAEPFKLGYKNGAQHMEDSMYTIFNVMYGERIDADWLQDAYLTPENARKSYKYKRLAQNQGYARNSLEKRQMLNTIYAETSNDYYKEIIDTYTNKEFIHALVINDGAKSVTGEAVNNFITDNRSVAEANLKKQLDNKEITQVSHDAMLVSLQGHHSINAEAVNAMTAVRREKLDYLLLLNGQENLIGESAGQKPVGLSSFTDAHGVQHVFYNKTHYFYDSRLDKFFSNNKDIDQVAFKSGAKKAKIIDPKQNLDNQFEPYEPPTIDSGQNIADFINGINVNKNSKSVMPIKFDQTLSGAIYGKAHDVKIMKQFDNWSSKEVALDMWEWARSDLAQKYAEVNVNLYNPEDTGLASREANSFLRSSGSKEGISTEVPNASVASIWMEANGVPFSEISKNLYDALIKRKYIDDAGVFDGYTDAGGRPILRGNLTNDLNIPVFAHGAQVKLGEAKVSEDYLDRDIHFIGAFGTVPVDKPGKVKRPNYRDKATLTIAFNHEGRDIIVDLKSLTVVDPSNPNAKLSDYAEIQSMVGNLKDRLKTGKLQKYRDVFNELQEGGEFDYKGAQLAIMAMPAPRTGPHDAMVVKIKDILPSKDGGIMELNSYDVTMRGQRDFDTDELAFYMDTPFSAMSESYRKSGDILEPLPTSNKLIKDLDMYSNQSYKDYNQNMQEYKRKRGTVVKMHRKLTYAKRLFDEIGSIKLGKDVEIVFNKDTKAAVQGLSNDSQGILDIYDGTPNSMKNMNDWMDSKLFGDNPFFQLKFKGKEGKEDTFKRVDETAYKLIVKKVLDDFGNLLNLEGNIWEGGEAKKPRYKDMVSAFRDFQAEYSRDRVNWNFYHYLEKKGYVDIANELFFKDDAARKEGKLLGNIMGSLSEQVLKNPTPFMKSLDAVASRDYNRVRETYSPAGDFFNKGIDQLIGRHRANVLEYFRGTGELTDAHYSRANDAIEGLWTAFYGLKEHESLMVQANTIQEQIQRSEWRLSEIEKNPNADPASIELQKENLFIKNESLQYLLNKMAIEPDAFGQELISYRKDMKPIKRYENANEIVIRDAKTGKFKFTIKAGEEHWLGKNEVAVKNPVVLKSIVEHELLDGIAFANSTLGYYAHVKDADMHDFRKIVNETKSEVKQSIMKIMKEKGYRDWDEHQTRSLASIEKGLAKIKKLAIDNAWNDTGGNITGSSTFFGEMPQGRETYGIDFLMSMLVPDNTGNPNERYFSPKTGNMLHAVETPKRSVINAVFQAMETYGVHTSHKEFVQNFARTHRGFYDALVAGRGFHEGMQRLSESNFEGALLKTTIEKAMHNPFMPRSDFKSLAETFEMTPGLKSDYAEMFRQMIQEGALTDPQTAFNIRKQIIESPDLGPDAYKAIFQLSRGQIVFDGLSSKQVGIHQGEGQLLGEVLMTRRDMIQRQLIGKKPVRDGVDIKDMLQTVIGRNNELKLGKEEKCIPF